MEKKNIDEWHGKNGYDDKEEEYVEGRALERKNIDERADKNVDNNEKEQNVERGGLEGRMLVKEKIFNAILC